MKKILLSAVLISALLIFNCSAQNKNISNGSNNTIDSLLTLLKTDKPDTNKITDLNNLSKQYINNGDYDSAIKYGNTALSFANSIVIGNKKGWPKGIANAYHTIGLVHYYKGRYPDALKNNTASLKIRIEIGNKKDIADSYNNIGLIYENQSNYSEALNNYNTSLKLRSEIGDKYGIAASFSNIGVVYKNQGDYPKALDNYLKALKIEEELQDKSGIGTTFGRIGVIYHQLGSFSKALDYYSKALKIAEELGNKKKITSLLGNIGNIYLDSNNSPKALSYYLKSLKISEEIGQKNEIAMALGNIGAVYGNQNDHPKALDYLFKALKINEELDNKFGMALNLQNIGDSYSNEKKYYEAEKYMLQALAIDTVIGNLPYIEYIHGQLSRFYKQRGNYKKAFEHYHKEITARDTIFNQKKNKEFTRKEMNFDFDKKTALTKAENDKQHAVAEEKNRRQIIISWLIAGGLFLVLVFAGFVFRSLRITRNQKNIIEIQKNEVWQQKGIIEKQKQIVEEKQKETVDSINYAKRIQYTLLANQDVLTKNLNEHFVLFQPKDIVSGDFYWAANIVGSDELRVESEKKPTRFYLAVCDSTGHGVPGAFMSLLNISFLNEAITEKKIEQPDEVLNYARKRLIESVSKDGAQDGMDGILLCFENGKITYAAANNAPIIVRENAVIALHADKMPIGKGEIDSPFTLHSIDLQKGDTLYLYTDGYADQFGGPKGKKFMYKQLDNLLITISQKPMEEQKYLLASCLNEWKGNLEQVDDILVIGIKI